MTSTKTTQARARARAFASRTGSLRAEKATGSDTTRVMLYAGIGGWYDEVGAKQFMQTLDNVDTPNVELHINSPGGDAFEGIAIANAIRQSDKHFTAVVDGLAASISSVIAVACNEVVMAPGAQMMIHDAWTIAMGASTDLRKVADDLDKLSGSLATLYARRGGDESEWRSLMLAETWFTDTEAVAAGLADRVLADTAPASKAPTEVVDDAGSDLESEISALYDAGVFNHRGRDAAPTPPVLADGHLRPAASAAGSPRPDSPSASAAGSTPSPALAGDSAEGELVTEEQLNQMRQKLGLPVDADADTILAALDESLEERADDSAAPTTSNRAPEGMVLVDEAAHAALLSDAKAGREAREHQLAAERKAAVRAAVEDGRIPPARAEHWEQLLAADPGSLEVLNGLGHGLAVNVTERGHAMAPAPSTTDQGALAYDALYGEEKA